MKLFLDSSFIIALILENDAFHKKAVLLKEKILENDCYISNLIINEVITVIGNKTDKKIAKISYYFLKDNCILIEEIKIPKLNDKIMETYLEFNTKLSFTDSNIVELMKENSLTKLVSFDKYFDRVLEIERIH